MIEAAEKETKMSLITRVRDYWQEHRAACIFYFKITLGLIALIVFIYLLHRSVVTS